MSPSAKKRTTSKPDCRTCGACCISPEDQESYCDLTDRDLKRLSPATIRRYVLETGPLRRLFEAIMVSYVSVGAALKTRWHTCRAGPFKGYDFCACALLSGSVFHRVRCRIYSTRPSACRSFRAGGRDCRAARRALQDYLERSHV